MNGLLVVIAFLARVGVTVAGVLRPLWRGWDWLTGRRTVHLAWVLYVMTAPLDMATDLRARDYLRFVIAAFLTVVVGRDLQVITEAGPAEGEVVPVGTELIRFTLLAMAGVSVLFLPSVLAGVVLDVNGYVEIAVSAGWILTFLAAAVDHEGGGKSVLARAAEKVAARRSALRPATAAA